MARVREVTMASSGVARGQPTREVTGEITQCQTIIMMVTCVYRVPAIISYPAMIPSGVNQHLMSSLDLLPTISGLLSLPPLNKTLDGWENEEAWGIQ